MELCLREDCLLGDAPVVREFLRYFVSNLPSSVDKEVLELQLHSGCENVHIPKALLHACQYALVSFVRIEVDPTPAPNSDAVVIPIEVEVVSEFCTDYESFEGFIKEEQTAIHESCDEVLIEGPAHGAYPMVIDSFCFYNELDLLEVRLEELYNDVDYFVIVECNRNFFGKPKPFHFLENKDRFQKYAEKIRYYQFSTEQRFTIELSQRSVVAHYLMQFPEDTVVCYGDVDEIPSRKTFRRAVTYAVKEPIVLAMKQRLIHANLEAESLWTGSLLFKRGLLRQNLNFMRYARHSRTMFHCGWHFKFMNFVVNGALGAAPPKEIDRYPHNNLAPVALESEDNPKAMELLRAHINYDLERAMQRSSSVAQRVPGPGSYRKFR